MLREVIADVEAGNIDADYGGGLIKQRVARPNQGKSSGYRTIILYRRNNRAFFVYGYAKKDLDNMDGSDERYLKDLATHYFSYSDRELDHAVRNGGLLEVTSG